MHKPNTNQMYREERFVVEYFRCAETYQNAGGSECLTKAIKHSLAVCCLTTGYETSPNRFENNFGQVFAELFSKSDRVLSLSP